ncbi:MAG TPA: chemotaxis protein CheC [Lachnospiraceae bacterium]|nr:chemotaxis protein CheC [Lachnospiraceae bacterium]
MESNALTEMHISALKEIGNIGAGNACTALAGFMNTLVDMTVPNIRMLDPAMVNKMISVDKGQVLGIKVGIKEDLNGMLINIVSREFASRLINVYYPKEFNSIGELDDMDRSVLCEMGNITSGACANSLATLTGMVVDIQPPEAYTCTVSELLKMPVDAFSQNGEKVVVLDEEFKVERTELSSHLFLILDGDSLNRVFTKIGLPPV